MSLSGRTGNVTRVSVTGLGVLRYSLDVEEKVGKYAGLETREADIRLPGSILVCLNASHESRNPLVLGRLIARPQRVANDGIEIRDETGHFCKWLEEVNLVALALPGD